MNLADLLSVRYHQPVRKMKSGVEYDIQIPSGTALPHFAALRYGNPFAGAASNVPEGFSLEAQVIRTPAFGYRAGLDVTIPHYVLYLLMSC